MSDDKVKFIKRQVAQYLQDTKESLLAGINGQENPHKELEDAYETGKSLAYMVEETEDGRAHS